MAPTPSVSSLATGIAPRSRQEHDGRLGVIGTGSSAVQITGALVDVVGELHLFQRTPQWVLAVDNPPISDEDRARYRADPTALVGLRDELNANFVQAFANAVVEAESPALTMLKELSRANLEEHVADPDLREKLRSHYRAGCKRTASRGATDTVRHLWGRADDRIFQRHHRM